MSDPGSTYRTRDEINTMRQHRDPVERVKKLLLEAGKCLDTEMLVIIWLFFVYALQIENIVLAFLTELHVPACAWSAFSTLLLW